LVATTCRFRNAGRQRREIRTARPRGHAVHLLNCGSWASEGRTIIEKIERHSGVGYAVVLLTGDDRGGLAGTEPGGYQPRARQNVVLELGYFLGKLGRRHVCVLHEPGVEIPSDYDGVVYVPLDPGGAWQLRLAREMKATAFKDIDLNRAM